MSTATDAELLEGFRHGNAQSLEALFERYESELFGFLLGILRHTDQAEDALQNTFVKALEKLDGVDGDRLRGWLFTVAYHQAMLLRRRQREAVSLEHQPLCDPLPDPLFLVQRNENAARVRELLNQLPDGQREVIRQRVYEGKKFREIADALRCPLNTALARMRDGLRRLRRLWGEDHD